MHHVHYFVVQATDATDAMNTAETYIEEWGTENNWRSVIGAFDRNGNSFTPDNEESLHFGMKNRTLADINKQFQEMIDKVRPEWMDYDKTKETILQLVNSDFSPATIREMIANKDDHNLWGLKEFFIQIQAVASTLNEVKEGDTFDVFRHEYRDYEYDEIGVTHVDYNPDQPDDEDYKAFVVLIDIHT